MGILTIAIINLVFCGVPFICIMIYGTCNFATVRNISLSIVPAEISLTMCAPETRAASATFGFCVSMEISISVSEAYCVALH